MNVYAKFQPPYNSWEDFSIFFRKFTLYVAIATNQIQQFGQNSYESWRTTLQNKNLNICSETAKTANFQFSHYKSMETIICHSNQSFYPIGTKNNIIRSPCQQMLYVKYGENRLYDFRDVVWKNVDDGQRWRTTTDACLYYKLTLLWSLILYDFFMILYMYIAPGQGQTAPKGQKFDVKRHDLSFHSFVASLLKISSKSDFIQKKIMI